MQTHRYVWRTLQRHHVVSLVLRTSVAAVVGLLSVGATLHGDIKGNTQAKSLKVACAKGDRVYSVTRGDTLGKIARRYNVNWARLSAHNHLVDPNVIYHRQTICIPQGKLTNKSSEGANLLRKASSLARSVQKVVASKAIGYRNTFPYGACTWWANQRYHQLYGIFVPWRVNADAWQWTARAYDFGWHVTKRPRVGAIADMQPGVQGAYGLGHVGIVEKVLGNGSVIISSMSWGGNPWTVTNMRIAPGPGVTFISR